MTKREIIYSFLLKYSEYHYQSCQIVLFKDHEKPNLRSFLYPSDDLTIIQIKGDKVFQKEVPFNDLNNSVINYLFLNDETALYNVQDEPLCDLYNGKSLQENHYKYLNVIPVFDNNSLIGGIFCYLLTNVQMQIQTKVIQTMINSLKDAIDEEINNDFHLEAQNELFVASFNNRYYLSSKLSEILHLDQFSDDFSQREILKEISKTTIGELTVTSYKLYQPFKILSKYELNNLNLDDYTLIYPTINNDDLEFLKTLLENNKQKLSDIQIYDFNDQLIIILDGFLKKYDFELFEYFKPIIVRSKDLTFNFSIRDLINYLKKQEAFDITSFKDFLENEIQEKRVAVLSKYQMTKVLVDHLFTANKMIAFGYVLKVGDVNFSLNENKIKALMALKEVRQSYPNDFVLLYLPHTLIDNDGKPYIKAINIIKELIDEKTTFIIDQEASIKYLDKYYPNIIEHLYLSNQIALFDALKYPNALGYYLDDDNLDNLFVDFDKKALNYLKYLLTNFKEVIVVIRQEHIVKIHEHNLLLQLKNRRSL